MFRNKNWKPFFDLYEIDVVEFDGLNARKSYRRKLRTIFKKQRTCYVNLVAKTKKEYYNNLNRNIFKDNN